MAALPPAHATGRVGRRAMVTIVVAGGTIPVAVSPRLPRPGPSRTRSAVRWHTRPAPTPLAPGGFSGAAAYAAAASPPSQSAVAARLHRLDAGEAWPRSRQFILVSAFAGIGSASAGIRR